MLVILGADWLTKGASALARRFNMSELLIGLTIVAIGTSLPELVISTGSAIKGSPGIALGNIIGSNIFNGMLILGVTALLCPIKFNAKMLTREIPFNLLASIVLILVSGSMLVGGAPGEMITRYGGMILLCFLAVFVRYTFSITNDGGDEEAGEMMPVWKVLLFIAAGLAACGKVPLEFTKGKFGRRGIRKICLSYANLAVRRWRPQTTYAAAQRL